MADRTTEFLTSPVLFWHRTAIEWFGAESTRLGLENVQFIQHEGKNFVSVEPTPRGEAGALFYVLGWKHGSASTGKLGSAARFFFTGPLSGCTFAVDKNWFTPRVVHVNQVLSDGRMDSAGMMDAVKHRLASCTSIFSSSDEPNITVVRSHERSIEHTYNIFGYRTRGGWTFYQQVVNNLALDHREVYALNELNTWF